MPETLSAAVENLRRDVERWEREIALLDRHGHSQFGQQLQEWVAEARRILSKSENPHA